jgi:hypothetical protein
MTTENNSPSLLTLFGQVMRANDDILFLVEKLSALKKIMIEMKADVSNAEWVTRMEAILGPDDRPRAGGTK